MSREQAAEGSGCPAHTAKFHLDRLVDEGLLDVEFRRLTGKTGPGAGRPAKLYRRSGREIALSLPQRSYDLLSTILAQARRGGRGRRGRRWARWPRGCPARKVMRSGAAAAQAGARGRLPAAACVEPAAARLRAADRGRADGAGELPVRQGRPRPHRAGVRAQPRASSTGWRQGLGCTDLAGQPGAVAGAVLRQRPSGPSSSRTGAPVTG